MIDLHAHTRGSDGDKTPEELIDLAISKKLKALAITDHDTTASLKKSIEYAKDKDIILIPGIEFGAEVDKGEMHILGLFIDYNNKELKDKLQFLIDGRNARNQKFVEEFDKLGLHVTMKELEEVSGGKAIGKPHFTKIFLQKGYIKDAEESYANYFRKPPFIDIKRTAYEPEEVIRLIKNANGIVILAHPQSLKLNEEELREKIKELKGYGLDGLECYHSKQTPEEMKLFRQIAKENNLLISKGSDYHGPITKPDIELGTGINNNIVNDEEDEILNKILDYNAHKKEYCSI